MGRHGLSSSGSELGQLAGAFECDNEPSGSIKCGKFLDALWACYFLRKDSATWSSLESGFRSEGARNNLTQSLCDIPPPLSHSVQSQSRFITSVHADSHPPTPHCVSAPLAFVQQPHGHLSPDLSFFSAEFLLCAGGITRHWIPSLWEAGFSCELRLFFVLLSPSRQFVIVLELDHSI
jgi:hypothetical protein